MQTLWTSGVKSDVLLQVTKAAPYVVKTAQGTSVSHRKLIHVTCVLHHLHRVCETMRVVLFKCRKVSG
jgi:hypothetical protein